jgi:hypothetical protein
VDNYTVKVYSSEKRESADGSWQHELVTLSPDSSDSSFKAIEVDQSQEGTVNVIAALVGVISS